MPSGAEEGDFVHEADVWSFLNLLTKEDEKSSYPFSNDVYRDLFKHSLWMVPGVKEARALKKLMLKHPIFGNGMFDIVNVAGNGDEEEKSEEALLKVRSAIKSAGKDNYTITLSCGKLTTGVTVKEWTAVFMLAGSYSTSAANYLQTIFRVQSPCNDDGKIKETSYVFDFAPDRTLKMVSSAVSVSARAGKTKVGDAATMGKFLNYCPVIAVSGSEMKEYSATRLLQQLKKAYADKVVRNGFDDSNLYNDELFKLQAVDIQKFDELKGIIGTSKAAPKQNDITVNDQGLTNEEYEEAETLKKKPKKELSPEEKARLEELKQMKKLRNDAISILRGISIRMPLLIYGADIPYDEEITLDKFVEMVDDSSWEEFMPTGVTKDKFKEFQKYYDEEVFIAAGRRIRNIAREADTYNPTDRVIKIASLFKYFKNPDKETVLTPWRVVNMHMSDCLGGWDFFGEGHSEDDTLDIPRLVDRGKVTQDVFFKHDTQILEINSKTGLYPLYVTYSTYMGKCREIPREEITLEKQRELWFETVANNIFVVCKTPMAKAITKRTLIGFSKNKINAHYFDDLINTMANKPQLFKQKILKESYWKKGNGQMKFDAVVGNPPYQEETGSTRKPPIYHYFYDTSFELSNIVSLITPGRFLFRAGQTPKAWNEKMLQDNHFKVVTYFEDSKVVFPTVEIKGGIAITLRDVNSDFGAIDVFAPYKEMNMVLNKVLKNDIYCFSSLAECVSSRGEYRLQDIFFKDFEEETVDVAEGTGNMIVSNIFDTIPSAFMDSAPAEDYFTILGRTNNKRVNKYISQKYVLENEYLKSYNVLIPEANGTGMFGETLSSPFICAPMEGATDTFISIGTLETLEEAQNLLKYIKCKFTRAMLDLKKGTHHTSKSVWQYVPLQDFTSQSDIDWTVNISNIDIQLYKKYGISEAEIKFIEANVQPMN